MASYAKVVLSGSTSGKNTKVVQTATAGTLIHTAHATALDEIWLWATNTTSVDVSLTLENGGVASPDDLIKNIIPAGETIPVLAGSILTGGLVLRAWAGTANVINVFGFVNRIS